MNKQFYFLSGLPRTGSTLLSSILSQNPNIHAEGSSYVCELMWQIFSSSFDVEKNDWNTDIKALDRKDTICKIVNSIPNLYYENIEKNIIIDKCNFWTLPANVFILKNFLVKKPKIIVLLRPIEEICSSFIHLRKKNNWKVDNIYDDLLEESSSLMKAVYGVVSAKENNNGEFLFVNYDDIVFNTEKTLNDIYDFCEWPKYKHHLQKIERNFIQNDEFYNLSGLHNVRKIIEKQNYHIDLPKIILKKCYYLNSLIFED